MRPRRWFKITEINLMRQWAEEGKSQSYAARSLERDPGVIAQAALRYGIQFRAGSGGRPKHVDPEVVRWQRIRSCRRYRQKRGAVPCTTRQLRPKVTRFDDPLVMAAP